MKIFNRNEMSAKIEMSISNEEEEEKESCEI